MAFLYIEYRMKCSSNAFELRSNAAQMHRPFRPPSLLIRRDPSQTFLEMQNLIFIPRVRLLTDSKNVVREMRNTFHLLLNVEEVELWDTMFTS